MTRGQRHKPELFDLPLPRPHVPVPLVQRPMGEIVKPYESAAIDAEGMRLAGLAAREARCVRRAVGATIYNVTGWYVASGHNGAAAESGLDCLAGDCPRGQKTIDEQPHYAPYDDCIAIHAEARVLLRVSPRARINGTMYVTDKPCHGCSLLLLESGLHRVVWPEGARLLR